MSCYFGWFDYSLDNSFESLDNFTDFSLIPGGHLLERQGMKEREQATRERNKETSIGSSPSFPPSQNIVLVLQPMGKKNR